MEHCNRAGASSGDNGLQIAASLDRRRVIRARALQPTGNELERLLHAGGRCPSVSQVIMDERDTACLAADDDAAVPGIADDTRVFYRRLRK